MNQTIVVVSERDLSCDAEFSMLRRHRELDPAEHANAYAFVLDSHNLSAAWSTLHSIRQRSAPRTYLVPVLVATSSEEQTPAMLAAACDGSLVIEGGQVKVPGRSLDAIDAIHARMAQVPELERSVDTNLAFKIVRFLFVRNLSAVPLRNAYDAQGYAYPQLEPIIGRPDGTVQRLLEFLETQDLAEGKFADRIYRCGRCHSAFLSVREACSHCQSFNLTTDDLIHHFRCAHVAPAREFDLQGGLRCPKCDRALKHIGVDYDKPSQVYLCVDCGRAAQDVDTLATCYRCGHTAAPEAHEIAIIKSYTLTALAENAARYGMESLFRQILESELEVLPIAVFKRVLQLEVERIGRYKRSRTTLAMLRITNLDQIYLEAGARAREIFAELAAILKSVLRTSDILTTFNESLFLILFVETPEDGAKHAMERIQSRIAELVATNLRRRPEIGFTAAPVLGDFGADQLVERLVSA